MRKSLVMAGALLVMGVSSAQAQTTDCTTQGNGADACQKAVDIFNYMAPQLGVAITGGNVTLGQGGTVGGIGHFIVGLRANVLAGSLPEFSQSAVNYGPRQQSTMQTKEQVLGLPSVDATIGIFGGIGIPLVTKIGGLDLLLSASYLPEVSEDGFEVQTPDGGLKIGYGARLGLIQEGIATPGISASYMVRDLPKTNFAAFAGNDSINVQDLDVQTRAWRVTVSKSLVAFGIAAGVGQDTYDSQANLAWVVRDGVFPPATGRVEFQQEVTRTNYFVDLSMNLLLAKIVAEVGMVQGGDIETFNEFEGKSADDSRLYGSLGVRVGF